MERSRALPLLVAATLVAHCAAPAPKPASESSSLSSKHQAVNPLAADDDREGDGMQVEGTLGTLDDEAIQRGLKPRVAAIEACFVKQLQNEPYLGGQVSAQVRVARDGKAKRIRLNASSIGSLSVERCVLKALGTGLAFARPRGGEAEFTYPLTFQARVQVQSWDPGMVKDEILAHVAELLAPREKSAPAMVAPNGLTLTFYVNARGQVTSAGMTADDPIDESFADRFVENLKTLKLTAPSGAYAKVTYTW